MAGHDRPGGPDWPPQGYPEEFGDPGSARGHEWPAGSASSYPAGPAHVGDDGPGGYRPGYEPDYPDHPPHPDYPDDDYDYGPDYWPEGPPARRPSRDDHPRRAGHRRGNILWRWRRGLFVAALVVMAMIAAGVSAVASVELPDAAEMQLSSFICTIDVAEGECTSNNAVARLSGEGNREFIRLEDVPPVVIDAVVAAEDRTFFEHDGLDPVGIARALYRDVRGGGLTQGGSTITQQFVKNTYLTAERTVTRKIREAVLAIKVEQQMSKEEILEGYLNTIYFGRNAYGLRAASRAYFGIDVTDENFGLEEASYLAALIRAPGLADAGDPERPEQQQEATRRRGTVLNAMVEEGYIDEAEQDLVEAMDWSYVQPKSSYRLNTTLWGGGTEGVGMDYVTAYVRDEVKDLLVEDFGRSEEEAELELAAGGLRVYTTIDKALQQQAYDAVYRTVLNDPARDPAAGLVALDDHGRVRAMVSGRDFYAENEWAQNNFAVMGQDGRQVGSTFKPIALATAAKAGYSFERTTLPAPSELQLDPVVDTRCDPGTYRNYSSEDADTGNLDLFEATAESSNTAFVGLMRELGTELGPNAVIDMAHDLGMDRPWLEEDAAPCLPTVLGSGGSSPYEMAEVYSTFANRGMHKEPTVILRIDKVDPDGEVSNLWRWQPHERRVLSEGHADVVTYALQGVIEEGTGTGADIGKDAAGKTGTTSNNRDAWFVGYVPRLTTAVWMGYPEPVVVPGCDPNLPPDPEDPETCAPQLPPMRDLHGHSTITGGSLPAQIWASFMSQATANLNEEFVEPTEEQREQGEVLGGGGDFDDDDDEQPTDTLPQGPPITGPDPNSTTTSLPDTSIPDPPESTTTTDTTLFPFPTSTTTSLPEPGPP